MEVSSAVHSWFKAHHPVSLQQATTMMSFQGAVHMDHHKPIGTSKKQLDVSLLWAWGPRLQISLDKGLAKTDGLCAQQTEEQELNSDQLR